MNEFDPNNLRSMMDFVDNEEGSDTEEAVLKFVENSIFLESQAHHWHLQCGNYAKHMELNEFYEGLPEYVDSFIEGLMQTRGALVITGSSYVFQPLSSVIAVLEDYKRQCLAVHKILDSQEEYGSVNTLEDIISFVDSILYKLKVLK